MKVQLEALQEAMDVLVMAIDVLPLPVQKRVLSALHLLAVLRDEMRRGEVR
jgi:hypothetical protein